MRLTSMKFDPLGSGVGFWPKRLRDGTFLYVGYYQTNDKYLVARVSENLEITGRLTRDVILQEADGVDVITAQCLLYELASLIPDKKKSKRHS